MGRRLWIFRVSGGEPFELRAKGNPKMVHDGGAESLLRCVCTAEESKELQKQIRGNGCAVFAHCPSESKAQKTERRDLLQILGGERNFPCVRCPQCSWFDPHLESLCGAGVAHGKPGWDPDTIQASRTRDKFLKDLEGCPLRGNALAEP